MTRLAAQPRRTGPLRWRPDTGFEYRCEDCAQANDRIRFWPLDTEFWNPKRGFRRCRACWEAKDRAAARANWQANKARRMENDRRYYRANRDWILPKRAAHYQETKTERQAYNRAYYARNREKMILAERARKAAKRALLKAA
jgi:hypothetical protein